MKRPAVVHIQTQEKALEMITICTKHGWRFIVRVERDNPEDIYDVKRLLKSHKRRKKERKRE